MSFVSRDVFFRYYTGSSDPKTYILQKAGIHLGVLLPYVSDSFYLHLVKVYDYFALDEEVFYIVLAFD
jgi:hypothetical protein